MIESQLVAVHGLESEQAADLVDQVYERDDIKLSTVAKDPDQLINSLIE